MLQIEYSISQLPVLKYQSADVAVLVGQGWVFNPNNPQDPSLLQRVERNMPEGMTYEVEMNKVIQAVAQSAVGMPLTYQRTDIPSRRLVAKAAVDRALLALNARLPPGGIRFITTETGSAQTCVTGSSYKPGMVQGSGTHQQQTVHSQETNLFIYLPVDESTVNMGFSVADELTKLKEHLDMGILTHDEFNVQKIKLLNRQ